MLDNVMLFITDMVVTNDSLLGMMYKRSFSLPRIYRKVTRPFMYQYKTPLFY